MMKSIPFFFCLLQLLVTGQAPKPELTQEFWNSQSFIRSFMGDYGFRTEVEPRISKSEQFVLREVVAKAENQLEEAIKFLEQEVSEESSPALDYALGNMYYQMGRQTMASQSYRTAIQKFPSFLRAHKNLGFVELNLGNLERATTSLTKAITLGEADGNAYVALGYCHLNLESYLSAENAYRMALLLLPESKDARNGLVNCFLYTDRFQQALALLNELIEKKPEDIFCHRARAHALQALGKEKQAAVALETLKRMGKLELKDFMLLGDLYHNLNLLDQSLAAYNQAISSTQKLPLQSYIRAARILIDRGSFQDGFAYLEKIEAIFGRGYSEEDEKQIRLLQSEVMLATGKDNNAATILEDLVQKYPLEGRATFILGQLAWKNKEYVKAGLYFDRAAKDRDQKTKALTEHARMLVSQKNYERAVELLEEAQLQDPQKRIEKYLQSINNLLISSRIKF